MSRLTELINKTRAQDPELAAELEREYRTLAARRSFGLNFERHQPEAAELRQGHLRRQPRLRLLSGGTCIGTLGWTPHGCRPLASEDSAAGTPWERDRRGQEGRVVTSGAERSGELT